MSNSIFKRFENRIFPGHAVCIAAAIAVFAAAVLLPKLLTHDERLRDGTGQLYGHDFALFWSATRLGIEEGMAAIWDNTRFIDSIHAHFPQSKFAPDTRFHYPPTILLVLGPLGAMPVTLAYPLMMGVSVSLLLVALLRIIPDLRTVIFALGTPLILNSLIYGQWSFLFAALMAFALIPVARGRAPHPLSTALFVMKPTLGLALPLAFIFAPHRWRTMGHVIALVLALILGSAMIYGVEAWVSYGAALSASKHFLMEGLDSLASHSTTLGTVLQFNGMPSATARALQWIFTSGILVVVAFVLRSSARGDLKASSIAAGTVLAAPYLMAYDLALLVPAAAFFVRDGMQNGFKTGDRFILALIGIAAMFTNTVQSAGPYPLGFALALGFFMLVADRAFDSAAENETGSERDQQKSDSVIPTQRLLQHEH